ncbi:MAG: hydrogenase maturation nickel metallochaperone HypA [Chlorobi bacterium]|nr:hydrogenase maturation nickel metallochaperone HypA [Chlorobiota bacterium]
MCKFYTQQKYSAMHEMSIALSIIELAESEAVKANSKKIYDIELDIGTLSGVEIQSLEFAFEAVKSGTILESADVNLNIIQAEGLCGECGRTFAMQFVYDNCPICRSYNIKLLKGKELKLKSLNVE